MAGAAASVVASGDELLVAVSDGLAGQAASESAHNNTTSITEMDLAIFFIPHHPSPNEVSCLSAHSTPFLAATPRGNALRKSEPL
jgi:hypothetical protein